MDPTNEFEKHDEAISGDKDQVAAGERIKRLRSFRGLTCAELAKRIGCTRPYLSAVENGRYPVSTKILRKLSGALNVTHDFFMNAQEPDLEDTEALTREMLNRKMAERARETVGAARRSSASRMIPVVSVTAAGRPLAAFDDFPTGGGYDYVDCPSDIADENAFALKITGDSMEPVIPNGSTIIVAPNMMPREGRPVVVKLESGDVTCKNFQRRGDQIILTPYNHAHDVQIFSVRELQWIYPVIKVVVDLYH
ncbi:putative HTH-type transcriptional regulator [Planctomycetaceae bacterium]|jgi:phage repressor protein C with HTH and peptisase S24 domain|nr:putative HTH-type transcriptional regulator [Planctomycetaceae bacterium]